MNARHSTAYAKHLHALHPSAYLRDAYSEGYDHPGDFPEDWGYSTFSAQGEAFREGQRQCAEDGSDE